MKVSEDLEKRSAEESPTHLNTIPTLANDNELRYARDHEYRVKGTDKGL
jgi:hypothetical protein